MAEQRDDQLHVELPGGASPTLLWRAAGEAGENHALLWADVFKNAEDLDVELFDFCAGEDGTADAVQAGLHLTQGEDGEGLGRDREREG